MIREGQVSLGYQTKRYIPSRNVYIPITGGEAIEGKAVYRPFSTITINFAYSDGPMMINTKPKTFQTHSYINIKEHARALCDLHGFCALPVNINLKYT